MAVRIIKIRPKPKAVNSPNDSILVHLSITDFQWTNEENQNSGVSSRESMFDWIVNKKGKAFIRKTDGINIPVFGVNTSTGQQYIRTVDNGQWTDELLLLPEITP